MSFKAKDLAYESKEPAFLQRLKNHYGSSAGRLERPIERPRKQRTKDDDDDAPTYVDEDSNAIISKEEYEALVRGSNEKPSDDTQQEGAPSAGDGSTHEDQAPPMKQKVAEIGGPKKRKQAKVVGDDEPAPAEEERAKSPAPAEEGARKPKGSSKGKKKKIKLSFDES